MDFATLCERVRLWMTHRDNNAIEPGSTHAAFDEPLLGCVRGDDPIFAFFKEDIGPAFYWTPEEAYAAAFPGERIASGELCVVAWVLPQTERTRRAHRKAGPMPSIEWSRARHYGERVNENLRRYVVTALRECGVTACAPVALDDWEQADSARYGFASKWSERHAAHACGLGTFGLSDGLITEAGKAVRVGSVVARAHWPATPRPYAHHMQWCLAHSRGRCLGCIKRCPADAISEAGHDKKRCWTYIRKVTAPHVERDQLGFRVNSCGLCQTAVPCERKNPTKK